MASNLPAKRAGACNLQGMTRIYERTSLTTSHRVDAEGGVLYGVKLLGRESRNNRVYTREAMEEAAPRYQGLKIYMDHPSGESLDRSVDRWAGTIQQARFESDGIYGDVRLRKKTPFFEGVIEAAQDFPKDLGFSHVADGQSKMDGDQEVVESIREIFSVDLVSDPATTAGIWESSRHMSTEPKTRKVREILAAAPESRWQKLLKEQMDGGAVDGDMPVEVAEEPDPAEEVKTALEKAAVAVVRKLFAGEIEEAAAFSEIKKILGMKDDAAGEEGEGDPPAPPAEESNKQLLAKVARLEAKSLLLESGREATAARIKALAATDERDRKDLLESWPVEESGGDDPPRPSRNRPKYIEDYEPTWETPEQLATLLR